MTGARGTSMSTFGALTFLACLYLTGTVFASIEFAIATGPCDDGDGLFSQCDDSAAGGLCASTADVAKKWCCPPEAA